MTRNDIIRMAREVFDVETDSRGRETFSGDNYGVERFAALVTAAKDAEHRRRLTDDEIGRLWFQAKIPGLTETSARLLIRAAEEALRSKGAPA